MIQDFDIAISNGTEAFLMVPLGFNIIANALNSYKNLETGQPYPYKLSCWNTKANKWVTAPPKCCMPNGVILVTFTDPCHVKLHAIKGPAKKCAYYYNEFDQLDEDSILRHGCSTLPPITSFTRNENFYDLAKESLAAEATNTISSSKGSWKVTKDHEMASPSSMSA
ncbi:hypothetical protein DXG03_005438 [Asterophora parasitica]|uniref:Uncharacterized protein n=1 Tax=Asterophora parasitica TaxID=117018 RepID=A0A9P7K9X0_9AGAR|nr:hypothetical protein DXG03_005438 [Asterophora parasitica]